jgi:uncharacterized cupin superfamily protein
MPSRPNIYSDDWERSIAQGAFAVRGTRLGAAAGARQIGAAVYEIDPGRRNMPYHAHHGIEEMILVLRGTPTLRSPDGERDLAEGEVVACPPGRAGAHQLINRSERVARVLVLSSSNTADLIEYPDSGKIAAHGGVWGTAEHVAYTLAGEPQLAYFDGEPGADEAESL